MDARVASPQTQDELEELVTLFNYVAEEKAIDLRLTVPEGALCKRGSYSNESGRGQFAGQRHEVYTTWRPD